MSVLSLSYEESDVTIFLELAPHNGGKTTGIDMI